MGEKNTRIQPVLLRVLSLGIGVNLSPFKDVWGSRIIFPGPSKFFNQANKNHQRETIHALYSVKKDYLKTNNIGEFRSEPISKVRISNHISRIKFGRRGVICLQIFYLLGTPLSWPG